MQDGQRAQDEVYIRCDLMCCHAHRQAGRRATWGVLAAERGGAPKSRLVPQIAVVSTSDKRERERERLKDGGWLEDGDIESERCGHCFDAGTRWCSRLPAPCGRAGAKDDFGTWRSSGLAVKSKSSQVKSSQVELSLLNCRRLAGEH